MPRRGNSAPGLRTIKAGLNGSKTRPENNNQECTVLSTPVEIQVRNRLIERAPNSLKHVHCECVGGALILQGRVTRYYDKQLAQETVRPLSTLWQIINRIDVDRADDELSSTSPAP